MKRKLLIGGACLLGLLVTVGVISFVGLRSWALAAPPPIDGRVLVGADTRFVLLYRAEQADADAVDLFRYLVTEQDARGQIPDDLKDLIRRLGHDDVADFVEDMLPLQLGVLVERSQAAVTFISFSKYSNLITHAIAQQHAQRGTVVGQAHGQTLYQRDAEFSVIVANSLLISSQREALEATLGRLLGKTGAADGSPVLARLPAGAPIVAGLVDDGAFLDALLAQTKDRQGRSLKDNMRRNLEMGAGDFDWLTLRGALGRRKLEGTVVLGLSRAADPARMLASVERLLLEFVRHFLSEKLELGNQSRLVEGGVEITYTLEGLSSFWAKLGAR